MPARALCLFCLALAGLGLLAPPAPADPPGPEEPRIRAHARLQMDRTDHDFGVADQETRVKTTFRIRNASDEEVERLVIRTGCGCNVVNVSKERLGPGEEATLDVVFETGRLSGKLLKRVRISTPQRSEGEITLNLRIAIVAGVVVAPASLAFRDVRHGTTPSAEVTFKWWEGEGEPFKIPKVEVPGHEDIFDVAVAPLGPTPEKPWRGHQIRLTFKKPPPLGPYSAEVVVRTDHEKHARVVLPLHANVVGQVWVQTRTLHFGIVRQGQARKATLKFRPQGEEIHFQDLRAESSDPRVQVQVRPDPAFPKERMHILEALVPADAEPGRLDDVLVTLHTGVPGEETVAIRVRGTVRKRSGG